MIDLLIRHAEELLTLVGPVRPRVRAELDELGIIQDGAVAAQDGQIVAVGSTSEIEHAVEIGPATEIINAHGCVVLPGFVDPHTHLVFAGDRAEEFNRRLQGEPYLAILQAGGGILETVRATRAASEAELQHKAQIDLQAMLRHGTTTVEAKSGYGLAVEDELKLLRVVQQLQSTTPLEIVSTLLGAHTLPLEYRDRREAYVDLVIEQMIPRAAEAGLATFCDVFCEQGTFTLEETRRILRAGQAHGLQPKLHADQITANGGAQLAAEVRAISADHLDQSDDAGLRELAQVGVVGVLLPGATFFLGHGAPPTPLGRRLVDAGVAVAVASDYNPGTCPLLSMQLVIGLAAIREGLTTAQAISAATINAGHAVGRGSRIGSLEVGKQADMVVLAIPSHLHLPYRFGLNMVRDVIKRGRRVHKSGKG
ncbi:MAG: imidazolonepropionase [Herpetosiphonaceae bacterium]|nr:imidazolonepropionase [Herpetosiphonaceae bacterium]